MEKQWEPVKLLRHARHDWLNQIQLIKANLSLNRVERAQEIIEEITAQSRNDSKLTNLQMPHITEMLLTFNWQAHFYRLETEVIGREHDLSDEEDKLFPWLADLLQQLDRCADPGVDNHVLVSFRLGDHGVFVTVDFSGAVKDPRALAEGSFLHKGFEIIEHYAGNDAFVLTIKIGSR
ncbi:MAG TPA: Spo0B C-terminal domain-containing protein [Bacillales bacterium]|nr:Spo0B C-terminal domain-containing protein [Bacillales bacterium]